MNGLWHWNFQKFRKQIWFPITIYGLLGMVTAVVAIAIKPFLPNHLPELAGADSVATLLNILASSMLAVTTFSLSIMFSAFNAAAGSATPRATVLLKDDRVTQNVLATFTGAFIYSLTGIIGLQTSIYGASGRIVLFAVTIFVLAAVIWQLVRWIGHLSNYGRLTDTIDRLEKAATDALAARMARPYLGARSMGRDHVERYASAIPIFAPDIGYVQFIDMARLQSLAEDAEFEISLSALPGTLVHPQAELARVLSAKLDPAVHKKLQAAFVISNSRTFEQDPRFGLIVLAEVASRALSPAVNDPGTAIDILTRQHRILALWQEHPDHEVLWDRIHAKGLDIADLFADAFSAIARDGASMIEVQMRLQETLHALALANPETFAAPAARHAQRALTSASKTLVLTEDIAAIKDIANEIQTLHTRLQHTKPAPSPALPL